MPSSLSHFGLLALALLPAAVAACAGLPHRPGAAPETGREAKASPSLEEILAPSLRGMDEVAQAPPETLRAPSRPSFTWRGELGRRELVGWAAGSESVGRPTDGVLRDGFEIEPSGPGWVQRGTRAFGTDELVAAILGAVHHVRVQYPSSVPVYIGDLSEDGGGPAPPHLSHQSGRDVDIGYYLLGNRAEGRFVPVDAESLDAEKTWALLEGFLATGMVQYVFVDYGLQGVLYDEAARLGWSEEALGQLFQYPRGPEDRSGIIRHSRGHATHFHLRIHCPVGDEACEG